MKRLILIIISIALLFSLVACGSNEKEISRLNGLLEEKTEQIATLVEENRLVKDEYKNYKETTEKMKIVCIKDDFLLRVMTDKLVYKVGETVNITYELTYTGEDEFLVPQMPENTQVKTSSGSLYYEESNSYNQINIWGFWVSPDRINFTQGVANTFEFSTKINEVGNASCNLNFHITYAECDPYWPVAFWSCEVKLEGLLVLEGKQ